jgi:ribosomal protein L11 methyltransferase
MTEAGDWVEVWLVVPSGVPAVEQLGIEAYLEPLTERCLEVCPGGLTQEDASAPPGDEGDGGRPQPEAGTVRLTLYVERADHGGALAALSSALVDYPGSELSSRPLSPDWRDRWKRWFVGFRVSERLAVRPPWEEAEPGAPGITLVIEPGLAFGTGQHETTWLCLEALDGLAVVARLPGRVLDVGCGTGILSIGAAKMGASEIVGLDVDPDAIAAARANAQTNGVAQAITLSDTPASDLEGTFPLVVANILAHILLALADALVARTAPGGRLILSGLLAEQADELLEAFTQRGCWLEGQATRGPWVRLDLVREAS